LSKNWIGKKWLKMSIFIMVAYSLR